MATTTANQPSFHERIQDYYAQKDKHYDPIINAFKDANTEADSNEATVPIRSKDNMPVHPSEEVAEGNLTDQVAKESSDSTASTHELHQEDTGATSGGKASAMDHKANPSSAAAAMTEMVQDKAKELGPVIAENLGEPESKEALKDRAKALNKEDDA
ncbi:hypothetical protein W97_08029 [Coniosporium apollinis CBS 100218]|uniref:Uncharacterized protein n=1 Tax=Coniosporium apollinis (strain CBS 100218) TaxID=1168221 RepID=R7Z4B8_CONA1|nr:uncharacterized protein W97_08029 [Coniosporium apollinis CBS 100218]EON68771.1 hypothetical protein W97_08029 [Coniosporium apollinis CBS 100218]